MEKRTMIERVTAFTEGCEEITEVVTHSAGMVTTKVTPLLSPVASGLCVLFAFYDGGGKLLTGKVDNPYLVSFLVGLVLLAVVEGINFSATFNRDRGEKLKAQYPDQLKFLRLNNLATWCFILTLATVGMLETLPGTVAWYYGEITSGDLGFRIGLLILPFFSKAGANIFSVSMILDSLEGTTTARRQKRLQEKRELAELEIEIETMRQQAAWELEQRKAEAAQRLELERLKVEAKLHNSRPLSDRKSVQISDPNSAEQEPNTEPHRPLDRVNATRKAQRELGKTKMLEIYRGRPDASLRDVGDVLGRSPSTVGEWLKELEAENKVSVNGQVHVI